MNKERLKERGVIIIEDPQDLRMLRKEQKKKLINYIITMLLISLIISISIIYTMPKLIRFLFAEKEWYCEKIQDKEICMCKNYKIIRNKEGEIIKKECLEWVRKGGIE